jgi:hypothetical protein
MGETMPNEPSRNNSKGGLIDDVIGIVRARSARRMNVPRKGHFLELDQWLKTANCATPEAKRVFWGTVRGANWLHIVE